MKHNERAADVLARYGGSEHVIFYAVLELLTITTPKPSNKQSVFV